MTEVTVLTICFFTTFGFIGYKLFGLIKKVLNEYKQKIEDNINESELLKQQAINALDEATKRKKHVINELQKNNKKLNEKVEIIKNDFEEKLSETKKKIIENSKKKIEYEMENALDEIKDQINKTITIVINEYIDKNISEKEKEDIIKKKIAKIDFKELVK